MKKSKKNRSSLGKIDTLTDTQNNKYIFKLKKKPKRKQGKPRKRLNGYRYAVG